MAAAAIAVSTPLVDDRLVDTTEAAEILGLRPQTLISWRCLGRYDLPYCKVGRSIRYRMSALQTWLERNTATHTGCE